MNVGVLAALISLAALVVVAISERVVEFILRTLAISRLRHSRRVPVIHDSDTWLPHIPVSIYKYRKYPGILLTILAFVLLIASELIVEFGVNSSDHCSPMTYNGAVISANDTFDNSSTAEKAASALILQNIRFLDGDLTEVREGFPRKVNQSICLVCLNKSKNTLVEDCQVTHMVDYNAKPIIIKVETTDTAFKTITTGFSVINTKSEFYGHGDLTYNGDFYSAFVFHPLNNDDYTEFLYLEYNDKNHIRRLLNVSNCCKTHFDEKKHNRAQNSIREDYSENVSRQSEKNCDLSTCTESGVREETQGAVKMQSIICKKNILEPDHFGEVLQIYRSMQLENTIYKADFNTSENRSQEIRDDDIYRAVLSMKIIDDGIAQDDYFVYTECGKYEYIYLIPFATASVVIVILGCCGVVKNRLQRGHDLRIPHNSNTWFQQVRYRHDDISPTEDEIEARASGSIEQRSEESRWRGMMRFKFDELVLEGDGNDTHIYIESPGENRARNDAFSNVGAGLVALATTPGAGYWPSSSRRSRLSFPPSHPYPPHPQRPPRPSQLDPSPEEFRNY